MCIPLAVAGLIASAAGAGVSAYGAVKQGNDARAAANYNADAQRKTATSVENQGAQQAADAIAKGRAIGAKGAVAAAASGVRGDTGTPLALEGQTAAFSELDSLRIANNAQRTAWGYQEQANLDEMQGKSAQSSGYVGAAGSILSGASSAFFGTQKYLDDADKAKASRGGK